MLPGIPSNRSSMVQSNGCDEVLVGEAFEREITQAHTMAEGRWVFDYAKATTERGKRGHVGAVQQDFRI